MPAPKYHRDSRGLAEILKSPEVTKLIDDAASRMAANIAATGEDVVYDTYTTDRAAASITVRASAQAKRGTLTRAAAALGLEVRSKT